MPGSPGRLEEGKGRKVVEQYVNANKKLRYIKTGDKV
jgi:hypothetical protein